MRNLLFLVPLLVLSGCMSSGTGHPPHTLAEEWRPLVDVRERPRVVRDLGTDTAITTIGTHCYVKSLEEWLARVVPGTAKYKALMRHEQEHSRRQIKMGTFLWVARYSYDKEFALLEEKIGYFYQITERRRLGNPINPDGLAIVLSRYKNLSGRLISFEEAKTWILDVLAGRWTPPSS